MTDGQFIAIQRPSRAEGVGRALETAFRDRLEMPADIRACIARLDRYPL